MFFFLILLFINIVNGKKPNFSISEAEINNKVSSVLDFNNMNTTNSLKTASVKNNDETNQTIDSKPDSKTFHYLSAFDRKKIKHDSDRLNYQFRVKPIKKI